MGPIRAVVFDTDGVITRTAQVHEAAWKRLFDDYLHERGDDEAPFTQEDYLAHVDGRPRYDGVATFLASRGIELPKGERSDPVVAETVCGMGNRKNTYFRAEVSEHGVQTFASTMAMVADLRHEGVVLAAVSASENQDVVLDAAGVQDAFDVLVDGVMARDLGLAGKPDPALFLTAAVRLGVPPQQAAVVEDARSGVAAGRAGGFGAVIGVDRAGRPDQLRSAGADIVVADLDEVQVIAGDDHGCRLRVGARP